MNETFSLMTKQLSDELSAAAQSISAAEEQLKNIRLHLNELSSFSTAPAAAENDFVFLLTVFVLACFVGYYVVWKVVPALHSPLMSVTNAISSVVAVGAIVAAAPDGFSAAQLFGLMALLLACVNIFGGFAVTARMLDFFKNKER